MIANILIWCEIIIFIRIRITIFNFFPVVAHKNEKKQKNVPEMLSKNKFCSRAVVAMQLCVCGRVQGGVGVMVFDLL